MFSMGLSNKEVVDLTTSCFGKSYSPQNISAISSVITEVVDEFKARPLNKKYTSIFIDATYVPIRFKKSYEKKALHLLVGITEDGYQDVLSYQLGFTENQTIWSDTFKTEVIEDVSNLFKLTTLEASSAERERILLK